MINAMELFKNNARLHPHKMAITDLKYGSVSFSDIEVIAAKVQRLISDHKLDSQDSVLVALTPSPALYGVICGLMGAGVRIVFIEPWLELARIQHVIELTQPKIFFCGLLGKMWGLRSRAIRSIPHWVTPTQIMNLKPLEDYRVTQLHPDHHAFIVFSSGTTGAPKGVIRTHQYMQNIYDVFNSLEAQNFSGPDLIIFPNVALFHLATGRGSILVPAKWSMKKLKQIFAICDQLKPTTISTGPAFLKTLIDLDLVKQVSWLERVVIGGALTDCWILEKFFTELPKVKFTHLYGGSEAEPVAMIDARQAVSLSRAGGYFQTLCLGEVIPQIDFKIEDEILWVKGPNVAGEYIGSAAENAGIKQRDAAGGLWHCMGDRVEQRQENLWIQGRQNQSKEDFELEQKIYSLLQSSKAFIHRTSNGECVLLGEKLKQHYHILRANFPELTRILPTTIIRDKRHRSRINRQASLPRGLRNKND